MILTTRTKIRLAKLVRKPVLGLRAIAGKGSETVVFRTGFRWNLDLNEGIDFAIYLLGGFELDTRQAFQKIVRPGMTVVDVGANIGAHTLPLAEMVGGTGRVVAVEPTEWAFHKLQTNLSLNPQLVGRVSAVQAMLVGSSSEVLPEAIYSSWPLEAAGHDDLHPVHLGAPMSTRGATAVTLDDLLMRLRVSKVDVIKLDVDGFELVVLQGAWKTIARNETIRIVMELAPYLFSEEKDEMGQLFRLFEQNRLVLTRLDNGDRLPMNPTEIAKLLPHGASMNVLLSGRKQE